ncbi:hypothetical protein ACGFYE_18830 [Streptomyces zaomyceticus]|uniref:hypothetical protein n=1 Tax=Streptomyces zaomyceticus TaxID=68286 RepID=UPI003714A253
MADRLHLLQLALADRIVRKHPSAVVTPELLLAQALVVTDDMYGTSAYAEQVERDLANSLPPILPDDTRDAYAQRLRLVAEGAVL